MTAFATSGIRLASDSGNRDIALFMILVGLLAGVSTLWGVRILKQKKRVDRFQGKVEWVAALALTFAGAAGTVYGIFGPKVLFIIFGALSAWTGWGFLRVLRSPPETKWFWWYEHLGGMLVGCISAWTAFLVVNWSHAPEVVRELIPNVAVWVTPGVAGGIAIKLLTRHWRARLEGASTVREQDAHD